MKKEEKGRSIGKAVKRLLSPEKKAQEPLPEENGHGIRKKYFKSRPVCKVTFTLPEEAAPEADRVTIAGEFNGWNKDALPLKKLRNGGYTINLELGVGREYRFRYFIDGERWENDWHADKYERNDFGGDDSVVVV